MATVLELTLRPEDGQAVHFRFRVESDELAQTVAARVQDMVRVGVFSHTQKSQGNRLGAVKYTKSHQAASKVHEALASLSDPTGWCHACQDEIAALAGLSTRHLRRLIGHLERCGLVQVRRVYFNRRQRNAYFLPQLATTNPSGPAGKSLSGDALPARGQADNVLSPMNEDSRSSPLSSMNHDDALTHEQKREDKKGHLWFIHEGERQARLAQAHCTPDYLRAWDDWFAAAQFGRLRNPAGWANSQIKKGYGPPQITPSLLSESGAGLAQSDPAAGEAGGDSSPEDDLWSQVLAHLQLQMSRATFETWLKDSQLIAREGTRFTVAVKNGFARDWLENRLLSTIERTLTHWVKDREGAEAPVELIFVVA